VSSQYHLKVSFQQILAKNSLPKIKEENNKKEEMMNRKKQRVINDSVLGTIFPRNSVGGNSDGGVEFYLYSHYAVMAMRAICSVVGTHSVYPKNLMKMLYLQ
jgi:hypothetical protein